jgi:hypothetical protein
MFVSSPTGGYTGTGPTMSNTKEGTWSFVGGAPVLSTGDNLRGMTKHSVSIHTGSTIAPQNLPANLSIAANRVELEVYRCIFGEVVLFIYQSGRKKGQDLYVHAFRSVCFAALAQYVGGNIFVNISGAMFWICAGSAIAENRWQLAQSSQVEERPLPAPDLAPEVVHAA